MSSTFQLLPGSGPGLVPPGIGPGPLLHAAVPVPAAPAEPLVIKTVHMDAHSGLVTRAVDRFDVAAHLEASGFGDAIARRHGATDVYEYARSLPSLPPGTAEAAMDRPRSRREGWVRALLLLAGAVVMALCAPAAAGAGTDLSFTIVATGLAGWVLGQLVGFVTWRRAGLGDMPGAARSAVGTAAVTGPPAIAAVTVASVLIGGAPAIPTAALATAWTVYAVALTLISVLGGLRPLAILAVSCAAVAVPAAVVGNREIPLAALAVLSAGGVALAVRAYRSTTRLWPALPSGPDMRSGLTGACHAGLMSFALLLALDLADSDDRIPLSIAVVLAAALCDPAIEDLGSRLRALSHRSGRWRSVLAGVLSRTVIYLVGIATATLLATWAVDKILAIAEDPTSGLLPDQLVLGVVAPVYAVFAFGSAIVLRAGRAAQAVWIASLSCVGYAALRMGLPVTVGLMILCGACLLAVFQAVTAALHPHSW